MGRGRERDEGKPGKRDGVHRSARTQEVREREKRAARRSRERNGAKLKGDEEYYGEKKRPHTQESGQGEAVGGGKQTTVSRGNENSAATSFSIPRHWRVVEKLLSRPF